MAAQEAKGSGRRASSTAWSSNPRLNLLNGAPFDGEGDGLILADFRRKVTKADLSDADRVDLTRRAIAALLGGFAAGYGALIAHLRAAEAKADATAGV